jgi:hypothetical protein
MRWISTLDIHGWGTETPESVTAIATSGSSWSTAEASGTAPTWATAR